MISIVYRKENIDIMFICMYVHMHAYTYTIPFSVNQFQLFILILRILTEKNYRQINTAHKMKFSIQDFFSKCDQIRSFLGIWSHLLKKSLMESFIFCAVKTPALTKMKKYGHLGRCYIKSNLYKGFLK